MATDNIERRTPWHLWVVGVIGIFWNGFASFDFVKTKTGGEAYLRAAGMTEAQIAYVLAMPQWTFIIWALGVFSGLLAAILLLLRKRAAAPIFLFSLIMFLLSLVYTYAMSDGYAVMGNQGMAMQGVVFLACVFFAWYSRRMAALGVLT